MPWQTNDVMERRIEFVVRASQEDANISNLCRDFNISRPTGYKWIQRYQDTGTVTKLAEKSRRPHRSPTRTSDKILRDASPQVKAGLTKQMLEGVSVQVAPHMKQGYEVVYMGSLTQQGSEVFLWKLKYRAERDDTLAKLVIKDGQVTGFWLQ